MDGIIQIKISKMTTISKWREYFGNIAMRRPRKAKKKEAPRSFVPLSRLGSRPSSPILRKDKTRTPTEAKSIRRLTVSFQVYSPSLTTTAQ
jgi:hypothetical protein